MNRTKYTKELFESIIKECFCVSDVCRKLNRRSNGFMATYISRLLKRFNIDTSHFHTGRALFAPRNGLLIHKLTWQEILIIRKKFHKTPRHLLLRGMKEYGFKYVCNNCTQTDTWLNKPLTLEIDHINENPFDNRPENLQFLCPNCHSQKTMKKFTCSSAVDQCTL